MNWNKLFIPVLLGLIVMIGLACFIKIQPRTDIQVRTVKSDPVTLPPKIISVTERIPDGEAESKLEICRQGYKDLIVRVNDLKTQADTEEGLDSKDKLFDIDEFAGIYGQCF